MNNIGEKCEINLFFTGPSFEITAKKILSKRGESITEITISKIASIIFNDGEHLIASVNFPCSKKSLGREQLNFHVQTFEGEFDLPTVTLSPNSLKNLTILRNVSTRVFHCSNEAAQNYLHPSFLGCTARMNAGWKCVRHLEMRAKTASNNSDQVYKPDRSYEIEMRIDENNRLPEKETILLSHFSLE